MFVLCTYYVFKIYNMEYIEILKNELDGYDYNKIILNQDMIIVSIDIFSSDIIDTKIYTKVTNSEVVKDIIKPSTIGLYFRDGFNNDNTILEKKKDYTTNHIYYNGYYYDSKYIELRPFSKKHTIVKDTTIIRSESRYKAKEYTFYISILDFIKNKQDIVNNLKALIL